MQLDARTLPDGASLQADVCIVGAGPAGLSLAAEFAGGPTPVVVVESGSWDSEPTPQLLNLGVVEGDPYERLELTRQRRIGGTTSLWNTPLEVGEGAKLVPLDPIDFRGEQGRPPWPITYADLVPYYRRAQVVAGLGPFEYEGAAWKVPASPIPPDHPTLASRVYQFSPTARFSAYLPRLLVRAPNITISHGATAVSLRWRGRSVVAIDTITAAGARLTIHAKRLVLAGGGIENTRMLLVEVAAGNLRDESGWLGHGFMEHPRDHSLTLRTTLPAVIERLEFFAAHVVGGSTVCGRIGLKDVAMLGEGLPNASVSLLPVATPRRSPHWRLEAIARRFGRTLHWPPGYRWSRMRSSARRFDGFQLLINLEEFPHRENRITLDSALDPLGVPRVRLHRRWHHDDVARLRLVRAAITRSFVEIGLGPIVEGPNEPLDPNAHHHAGTTRMGSDARSGVTDSYGRVFGADNLYVIGGSLFPAAGYANPTLTTIALALRVADHLKSHA